MAICNLSSSGLRKDTHWNMSANLAEVLKHSLTCTTRGGCGSYPQPRMYLLRFSVTQLRPGGKTGPRFHAKNGLKINTETGAPTVGAPVSVFILSLGNGPESWAQQTSKNTCRIWHSLVRRWHFSVTFSRHSVRAESALHDCA